MNKLTLLLLLPIVLAFQSYTPETYPDSILDPINCGVPEPGNLCDPNGVLKAQNGTQLKLIHLLAQSQSKTNCSCGQRATKAFGECEASGTGFIISVALTQNMVLNDDERDHDTVMKAAKLFAETLRSNQNRGHCQDDLVIFVSQYDNVVWTAVGMTTQLYLSTDMITSITTHAETMFARQQYFEGLQYMINSYVTVLRGEALEVTENEGWYWPLPEWAVIAIGVTILLLILLALGVGIYCCVSKCKNKDRRGHYAMGTRM